MPTTTTLDPPTGARPVARRRRLSLVTDADSDVVVRVLILLRRRGCTIVSVHFRRADRHGPGSFEVTVEAPGRIEHCLASWLKGLVEVRSVDTSVSS
jgi:acetolactate synthase regulatory subunit